VRVVTPTRNRRTVEDDGADAAPVPGEATMADKSPRQHMTKKSGKSLKEKRALKRAKEQAHDHPEIIPTTKKR
jgi:hypothetical protein